MISQFKKSWGDNVNEYQPPTKPVKTVEQQTKVWAMVLHLSQVLIYAFPVAGIAAPILIWQLKKNEYPELDVHGKIVANWLVTIFVMYLICIPLTFVFIGIFGWIILPILHTVFAIIGGIKANSDEVWPYPITFIKVF